MICRITFPQSQGNLGQGDGFDEASQAAFLVNFWQLLHFYGGNGSDPDTSHQDWPSWPSSDQSLIAGGGKGIDVFKSLTQDKPQTVRKYLPNIYLSRTYEGLSKLNHMKTKNPI